MENIKKWVEAYHYNRDACMEEIFNREDRYPLCRELFEALFDELEGRYRQLGISEKIYQDTRTDLDIWSENCFREHGVEGLANYRWLQFHLDLKLFRLGRLQFEPVAYQGRVALNVHVPQGEPLDYERCRDSYRQAYHFFHGMTDYFVCGSWLLSPVLRELLPPESNIIRFQDDFTITALHPDDRQCEERVFGAILDDYAAYPQNTRLQRAVRSYLLGGGKIGTAQGEFFYCPEE